MGDHIVVLMCVQKDIVFGEMQRVQNLVRCQFKTSDLLLCSYVAKYADSDVATTSFVLNCIHSPPRMYWHGLQQNMGENAKIVSPLNSSCVINNTKCMR